MLHRSEVNDVAFVGCSWSVWRRLKWNRHPRSWIIWLTGLRAGRLERQLWTTSRVDHTPYSPSTSSARAALTGPLIATVTVDTSFMNDVLSLCL